MKALFVTFLIWSLLLTPSAFATDGDSDGPWDTAWSSSNTITQFTTEMVPGADCVCVKEVATDSNGVTYESCEPGESVPVAKRKYKCTTYTGIKGFAKTFQDISGWVVRIGILLGVLAIAALGIAWAIAGDDDSEYKKKLKNWVVNLIIGLIILFAAPYILSFLGSWIYQ